MTDHTSPEIALEGDFQLTCLTIMVRRQLNNIKNARTILTAAFSAAKSNKEIRKTSAWLAEDIGVGIAPDEKQVVTLKKLLAAADARGLDTAELKSLMPEIEAIAAESEGSGAGVYGKAKSARRHLKSPT